MFDYKELEKVIELHEKSYKLFLWINIKLKELGSKSRKNTLFDEVHEKASFYTSSFNWIRKHYNEIPFDSKPEILDIESFAHLFTSYLKTSFIVSNKVKVTDGCPCPFCTFFYDVTAFQVRNPNKKATENAQKLKSLYIQNLCREAELNSVPNNIDEWILNHEKLSNDVSLATYTHELIRRSKYTSQGEGILVLWREIAWKDNHLNKKFKLSPQVIISAESCILDSLRK